MKTSRSVGLVVAVIFTLGPIISLSETKNAFEHYALWCWVICMWAGFGFACASDNIAVRKGYHGKFVWGFLFGFWGFLYWALIPPVWDHPEFIEDMNIRNASRRTTADYPGYYAAAPQQRQNTYENNSVYNPPAPQSDQYGYYDQRQR
ncbi:MAG: hypothetical protein Q4B32_10530 [Clostridia bacterium]|nr:hypothetical protein [Clostridia bacterium]